MPAKITFPCPFFPDMPCPRGEDAAEACRVRMEGDFDPVADFRDSQLMDCAIMRSGQSPDHIPTDIKNDHGRDER